MKLSFLAFVFILILPYVYAQESSNEASFFLPGCTLPTGERVARESCSVVTKDYYCSYESGIDVFHRTIGQPDSGIYCLGADKKLGGKDCCPDNMECIPEEGCRPRTNPCETYTTNESCESHGCAWINNGLKNVCRNRNSLSCSDYATNTSCLSDAMSLGNIGFGTDKCRLFASVNGKSASNCRCSWASNKCTLVYDLKETIFVGEAEGFSCEKDFTVGECIDGEQKINWTAAISEKIPASYTPSDEEIKAAGCESDESSLLCGEKLVKLPFFSLFNVISIVFILSIFYFFFNKKH